MPRPNRLTADQTAELIAAYQSGQPMAKLAGHYQLTTMGVSKLLRRNGVQARPRGRPRKTGIHFPISLDAYPQVPDQPPVAGVLNDRLVVAVADPAEWHVHAIMERYGIPHAQAARHFVSLRTAIESGGRQLLLLWSDELSRPGLGLLCRHKAGRGRRVCSARQADIVTVDRDVMRAFYDRIHLQGSCPTGETLGLEYEGRLVACMTFGRGSACRGDDSAILLQRFAADGSIPGAASRLLTAFRRQHAGRPIISYSDERYAPSGSVYGQLGFVELKRYKPDYRYWRDGRWWPKNAKQRKHLIRELGGEDRGLTEFEMATQLGYRRCYDLGKLSWRLV